MQPSWQAVIFSGVVLVLVLSLCDACSSEEREALLSFLADLSPRPGDDIAASWRGSPDCCTWDGVSCGGDGAVTRVWLPRRGLGGTISPAIASLAALTHLNLSRNSLDGPFPAALLSLSNASVVDVSNNRLSGALPDLPAAGDSVLALRELDVSSNLLAGQFPIALWEHTPSLVSLNASNNSFQGSIPSLCATCPSLAVLDLSMNMFGGSVPPGFGNCSRLRVFNAGRNNISGELPDDLFDVKTLEQLLIPWNQIQGRLDPGRIAKLNNLVKLDLSTNALTGELPGSISQLPKLKELRLGRNNLTGTLPPSLSNWTALRCLDLLSNSFVGDLGAVDFSGLANLNVFDMASNNFTGSMPRSIYTCRSIKALRVANNQLGGQVAPEIGGLHQLQFLSLTINSFTNITGAFWNLKGCRNLTALLMSFNFYGEALPDAEWVGDHVSSVRMLVLEGCQLTGKIPSWLSKLQDLNVLNLGGNRLTGPIPSWLGAMKKLYYIDLSGNQLSGEIPMSLMDLPLLASEEAMAEFNPGHMPLTFTLTPNNGQATRRGRAYYQMSGVATTLNLSDNQFTGAIPSAVGRLKTLQVLDVSYNNISGSIPPEIGGLARLQILDLRRNRLTGTIPQELKQLNFLAVFNVAYNDLEGPIPTGGQFDALPAWSFKENPRLCGDVISVPCSNKRRAHGGGGGGVEGEDSSSSNKLVIGNKIVVAIVLGVCSGVVALIVLLGCVVITVRRLILSKNGVSSVRDGGKFFAEDNSLFGNSMSDELYDDSKGNKGTIVFMSEHDANNNKSVRLVDIVRATNNFSETSIVGSGAYGMVYLAELDDGTRLAVKKLNGDMCLMEREFRAEVEGVKLFGDFLRRRRFIIGQLRDECYDDSRAIRAPSIFSRRHPMGTTRASASDGGHSCGEHVSGELDDGASGGVAGWMTRGVLHIHDRCTPQIVHRDIKSSNILLDEATRPRVRRLRLRKAHLPDPDPDHRHHRDGGHAGYIPPEYGQAWTATRRDVTYFGVVLLELPHGAAPRGNQCDEAQMLYVLDLACLCVDVVPFSRPAIQDVVSWLDNVDTIRTSPKDAVLPDGGDDDDHQC
ncbi:hypothetical protein PR202_gb28302 [Eleusine coracana subsp. coracana]|uniref:Protein kinase domain-containing protein n=1 Tax=Eleusine coracana subsp. coracana TaxID=191504 RepID=A0AAV5FWY9_ELECO|nr:hypothetical protein PR202_gb28302 [Eleusine coracana subsp. coracana]